VSEPMYRLIARDLRELIESGAVRPGEQLPTELELRDRYRASRNTVRDAVKWLITRGMAETRPGQGTFAARHIQPFVTTLSPHPETGLSGVEGAGAFAEAKERGQTPSASGLRVEVQLASSAIAARLRIPEGTQVVTRRLEMSIDRLPWSLRATAYPMDLLSPGALDLLKAEEPPGGAAAYLKRTLGIEEVGHRDRILVRQPNEGEARFFRLPDDGRVSMVAVIRTGYRDSGQGPVPYRVTFTIYPADRNQFVINSGRVPSELAAPAKAWTQGA
jgi:GntR family transcriptional regulator